MRIGYERMHIVSFILIILLSALPSGIAIADENPGMAFLKALYAKDFQRMEYLLKKGVDINAPIKNGLTPLAEAAYQGDIGVVEFLLGKGAKLEGTHALPNSPMYFAIFKGHAAVVQRFLDLGIPPNYTWPAGNGTGGTLLTVAVDSGHPEIVTLLVQRGADVNFRGSGNYGPLYRSMYSDYFDIFRFLINTGACLNELDKAALSEWKKNEQHEKYLRLLKENKGCSDTTVRPKQQP